MSDSGMRNFNNDILDYYAILGVPRYASTNDIGNAYKNLVYIHHPDKNIGDEDALMRYKAIDEAYRTLMNSDSRKSYDDQLLRNENSAKQLRNSDSTFGKVFGVVISRFDNSKDYLSVESKDIAKSICLNAAFCDSDATLDARVTDLVWGLPYDGRVERSSSDFYRLLLRDNDLKNGFLVSCKSLTKDKFKIIIYNSQDGEISQQV
jgi:curved DNA-binding protein CbpA